MKNMFCLKTTIRPAMKNLSKSKIDEHKVECGLEGKTEIYCDFVIAYYKNLSLLHVKVSNYFCKFDSLCKINNGKDANKRSLFFSYNDDVRLSTILSQKRVSRNEINCHLSADPLLILLIGRYVMHLIRRRVRMNLQWKLYDQVALMLV
jgi:hypothetical protein